ncbi:proton myo-inositol cotransporter-like isoform X1 [Biomphalaria glabrata]|uniref:Proton myo-inositol cotransporter-like isoform X1 n=2 Tax=Biomphalaria glabrata TaxID=6526 RepID=A0A9W3A711_BIOGL|nr:proton myo-inositol cotransporter-like isoform X1 [Biomphalaria glabrata]
MQGDETSAGTDRRHPSVIYCLAICATVSGFLMGYDTGIINGAVILIDEQFTLTDLWISLIVSSTIFSAAMFSFVSGALADTIGRKLTIMISGVVFSIGGGIMGVANGTEMLLVGRLVVGASIGIASSVVPVYVSECAPADIRGQLITMYQLFITVGIMASALLAAGLQELKESGWRWMLGSAALPGMFQFIFFILLPESPRYQMMRGQTLQALNTLRRIRGLENVEKEMLDIQQSLDEEEAGKHVSVLAKMLQTPHVRKALFIGCSLQMFQQFCGINTVIYYSATILKYAGYARKQALWLACIPATFNFLATFIALWAVETTGRKMILAFSFGAIAGALGVMSFGFAMVHLESPPASSSFEENPMEDLCSQYHTCEECIYDKLCGYCASNTDDDEPLNGSCISTDIGDKQFALWGKCSYSNISNSYKRNDVMWVYGLCPSVFSFFAEAGLILVVLSFAPGAGPMPWTINAEIYPSWCRGMANSLATLTNWTCNLIVSFSFLTLKYYLYMWGTFLLFGLASVLGSCFVVLYVPETKGKTLEEIQLVFMNKQERQESMPSSESQESQSSRMPEELMQKKCKSVGWLPVYRTSSRGSTELE